MRKIQLIFHDEYKGNEQQILLIRNYIFLRSQRGGGDDHNDEALQTIDLSPVSRKP